ncbi:MAG: tRNA (adenosine(37)-N6)-threonylcarbamoyltransferase complex dimerization subunit type 1 TsaB [Gammaproteobacteria bacterium]|nr:tRNA (adenosine(37)-N6)-threonylcarbamoyltransferase complex dimerization subunit type 1 TsaB [Gammaproteobacteria bacterium]
MNILAIDTSTEACSAALLRSDGQVFGEYALTPRQHTRYLPQMMDSVLAAADLSKQSLTHCAFANGPGAFTGIRIAAATIQGIAIGLSIPVVQISTLATLAQTCFDRYAADNVVVALDARMDEVYWARYKIDKNGLALLVGEEKLNKLEDVVFDSIPACGAGHGWEVAPESWLNGNTDIIIDSQLLPDARSLLKLAQQAVLENHVLSAEKTSINYLRNRVAEQPRR